MKFKLSILILTLTALCAAQQTQQIYLTGTGNDNTKQWDFYCSDGMNSKKWSKIEVPSCWELQGFGNYNYGQDKEKSNEHGIYKTAFTVPKTYSKQVVELVFEGVMTDAEVKVNGTKVGARHQGAFYRFSYDISAFIKYGNSNTLEVRVDKTSANESVNNAERKADYWVFGGIYRPVYLNIKPATHLEHIAIDARMGGQFTTNVRSNKVLKRAEVKVSISEDGQHFKHLHTERFNGLASLNISTLLKEAKTWNPESPNLYKARFELIEKGKILHSVTEQFGFRTVEVRPHDGIYVNNRKVIMKGVNRHSFWPESGRTTSKKLSIADVKLMQEMNMNAVRMSHYPPDKHFLEVCDSMGMFVLNELAGWQAAYDTQVGEKLVKEMVERDVNHPCIILWDNGNESGWNTELDDDFAKYDIQKRKVIHPMALHEGMDTQHYKNYHFGVNCFIHSRDIFFPTEYLHGMFDGGSGAGLEDAMNQFSQYPNFAGIFLWVFTDEGVLRTDKNGKIDCNGFFAPDGIVGPYREKEGSFYTIRDVWSPVNVENTYLSPFSDGRLKIENRYIYTNLKETNFKWEFIRFDVNLGQEVILGKETNKGPDVEPGYLGYVNLKPDQFKKADMVRLTVFDKKDKAILTKTFQVSWPSDYASRIIKTVDNQEVFIDELSTIYRFKSGNVEVEFDKQNACITSVKRNGSKLSFSNGPLPTFDYEIKKVELKKEGKSSRLIAYGDKKIKTIEWEMLPGGLLKLNYTYNNGINGEHQVLGMNWSYPKEKMKSVRWLGDGPYRVWKNRMKGVKLGYWEKEYNEIIPG
ncbi:MAG: hypothetical protein N4A71_05165 [Carboxylicivirga sp.]|jgi:hypothetical protein|nr:hypothetical protein [Carboxylicivirga sp.]